jgi:hypothetical protein
MKAEALAVKIGQLLIKHNSNQCKSLRSSDTKPLWKSVNEITNKKGNNQGKNTLATLGLSIDDFNNHYADISTDTNYVKPTTRTANLVTNNNSVDEITVFRILDTLKMSSSGPDGIPSWFLRLAAPVLARSLAHVYSLSISSGIVPKQWKSAIITPVEKINNPLGVTDFRPISVTSILSRKLEHIIVNKHIYPAMLDPPPELIFSDQYAFRPTGSATAALIAVIDTVTELLRSGSVVVLISLDFSKAFDRIRHKTLLDKFDKLDIDDNIYAWLCSYFEDREHSTKFQDQVSNTRTINASVVQGSSIGPGSFSVAASDLKAKNTCFRMFKFADDVDLVTTLEHYSMIQDELEWITTWADANNLILNKAKTKEIIFHRGRSAQLPPPTEGIERVDSLRMLGVVMQSSLSMTVHVDGLMVECSNKMYAMNLLRAHGLNKEALQEVFRSKILTKIMYAAPAWSGLANQNDVNRIDSFLRRSRKFGFYADDGPMFSELCCSADRNLFNNIEKNTNHVLYKFLPPHKITGHNLRKRKHNYSLPQKDDRNFIQRMLYRDLN